MTSAYLLDDPRQVAWCTRGLLGARLSRTVAVDAVASWGVDFPDEATDTVRRVVGELVANAVLHTPGPVTVEMRLLASGNLALHVTDPWGHRPASVDGRPGKTLFATIALPGADHRARHRSELLARRARQRRTAPLGANRA